MTGTSYGPHDDRTYPPPLTAEQWADPGLDYVMGRRVIAQLATAMGIYERSGAPTLAAQARTQLADAIALWPEPARELGLLAPTSPTVIKQGPTP